MATATCQMPDCRSEVEMLYPTDHGTAVAVCCEHKSALGGDYKLPLWLNEHFEAFRTCA